MRNLGLDLLRITAVLLVLGRHLHLPAAPHFALQAWQTGGWVGVDLFFVLSGFLVSGLLYREYQSDQSVDLKRFIIRRGFKIYPAFYAMIGCTILVRLGTGQTMPVRQIAGELLFFQNYLGGLWSHTWSLAVEEHFYIGMAMLCLVLLRRKRRTADDSDPFRCIPAIFFAIASLCLILRITNLFVFESYSHKWFLFGTHIRIDSLMFGVFISYLWHFRNLEKRIEGVGTVTLIGAGTGLLLPAFIFPLEQYKLVSVLGVILFYAGSGALLLAAIRLRDSKQCVLMLGGALGAASYSIYLWHMPVATWGWMLVKKVYRFEGWVWYFSFYMIGSLMFGWLMNKMLEWPALRMRDRLFPKSIKTREAEQDGGGLLPTRRE